MSRIISIRASDVAAIIGHHPYKPRDEILNEFWKRYAPESFQGRTALEDAQEVLEHSSTARNILYAAIHEKPKDSTQVQQVFKKARLALEADDQLTETQKTTVIDHLRSRVYTSHGTRSEHKTSHKISASAEEGVRIVRDPKVYTLPLHTAGSKEFMLTGKIDRIEEKPDGSRILVEIKNRANRLFGKVVEYENIQVQVYLQLLGLEHARLVEQYNQEIASYEVPRDDALWVDVILPGLLEFCVEFGGYLK